MSVWIGWFDNAVWEALIAALLHTVWLGALAAAALGVALCRLEPERAALRCALARGAMLSVLLGGCVFWAWPLFGPPRPGAQLQRPGGASTARSMVQTPSTGTAEPADPSAGRATATPSASAQTPVAQTPPPAPSPRWFARRMGAIDRTPMDWTPWLATAWLLGVGLALWRTARSVAEASRIQAGARSIADAWLTAELGRLSAALGLARRVALAATDRLATPVVAGILRPVILIPASMLGLPPDVLRAALAHEVVHVLRHDTLLNAVQMVVEALLFFNPFIWWIGRRIRVEREADCDLRAAEFAGGRAAYARAVVTIAERALAASPAPAAATAMTGGGGLRERIERLLRRDPRPGPALSGRGSLATLGVALAIVAVLLGGTLLLAGTVFRALTPAERVARYAALDKDYGRPNYFAPISYNTVRIKGAVAASDGGSLAGGVVLYRGSKGGGISGYRELALQGGRFEKDLAWLGPAMIAIAAPGYAPAVAGPFTMDDVDRSAPDAKTSGTLRLNLTLEPGHTAEVHVTGPDGAPIAGAEVRRRLVLPKNYGMLDERGLEPAITGADGVARLEHLPDLKAHLTVAAPGFAFERLTDVDLPAGRRIEVQLKPTQPAVGVVRDRETGRPIAGARLELMSEVGPRDYIHQVPGSGDTSYGGKGPLIQAGMQPLVATTDAAGRFSLDELRPDETYGFLVSADGYTSAALSNVVTGAAGLEAKLGPELWIEGRVLGFTPNPKSYPGLPKGHNWFGIEQEVMFLTPGVPTTQFRWVTDLKLVDGEYHFEIRNLWPGNVIFTDSKGNKTITVDKPTSGVVVDLRPTSATQWWEGAPMRPVRLIFKTSPGSPPIKGSAKVTALLKNEKQQQRFFDISCKTMHDGVITLEAPAGGEVRIERAGVEGDMVGYWFDRQTIEIPKGTGPFEKTIEVEPAGCIRGRLLNADGTPADGAFVTIEDVREGLFHRDRKLSGGSDTDPETGRYMLPPLPLGVSCRLRAVHGFTIVVSDDVRISARKPFPEIDFRFPKGVTVSGRVRDSDGHPVLGASVALVYQNGEIPFSMTNVRTDRDGRFALEGVNPDVPGSYQVEVSQEDPPEQVNGRMVFPNYRSQTAKARLDGTPMEIVLK